jgi:uncharacterized protein (DUF488 family)
MRHPDWRSEMTLTVYTIGHSTHSAAEFIELLHRNAIEAIADVRSSPYSRHNPQYNRQTLRGYLGESGIAYVFLGCELGARSEDADCYRDGKVQFDRLAQTPLFQDGLERVKTGARRMSIALMCAERDPLQCHRAILVSRYLVEQGVDVRHILADGGIESHADALRRLKRQLGIPDLDLFGSTEALDADAYRIQGERMAYQRPGEQWRLAESKP